MCNPESSVSFAGNHDTQRLQALESTVEDWFRPIAYAVILLSENAYPCVFYPDLFGAEYVDKDADGKDENIVMPIVEILPSLMQARQKFAYGEQVNYFDHPNALPGSERAMKIVMAALLSSLIARKVTKQLISEKKMLAKSFSIFWDFGKKSLISTRMEK